MTWQEKKLLKTRENLCIFSKYELLGKKIKLSSYKISGVRLEDQMVGWHHRLNGYDFEQAPGIGDG